MQAVIALPGVETLLRAGGARAALLRDVGGVPLLARVIATAARSGVTNVLVLRPDTVPPSLLKACLNVRPVAGLTVNVVALNSAFDPDDPLHWPAIRESLEEQFLWLPWNLVLPRHLLTDLLQAGQAPQVGVRFTYPFCYRRSTGSGATAPYLWHGATSELPAVVVKRKLEIGGGNGSISRGMFTRYLSGTARPIAAPNFPGVAVTSRAGARQAEHELVRGSGKPSDGIYSRFNRWLSRPFVRWFAKTPMTPNAVTFGGLGVSVLSGVAFAQGQWRGYVLGALLYFASVLFDEIDGMLARITFRESAFGCWLETFVDYATYVFLFGGMTVGLYRQNGRLWLAMGGLLLLGAMLSFLVLSRQRKLATEPNRPQEYRVRLHRKLEQDSRNPISWCVRRVEFLVRKPAYCHYVLLFSLLGWTKGLFVLTTLGANLVWIFVLYFNRLFLPRQASRSSLTHERQQPSDRLLGTHHPA